MECHGMPWNALWWIAKRDLEYVCICSLTNIVVLVVAFLVVALSAYLFGAMVDGLFAAVCAQLLHVASILRFSVQDQVFTFQIPFSARFIWRGPC